jgi:hypothetical protein
MNSVSAEAHIENELLSIDSRSIAFQRSTAWGPSWLATAIVETPQKRNVEPEIAPSRTPSGIPAVRPRSRQANAATGSVVARPSSSTLPFTTASPPAVTVRLAGAPGDSPFGRLRRNGPEIDRITALLRVPQAQDPSSALKFNRASIVSNAATAERFKRHCIPRRDQNYGARGHDGNTIHPEATKNIWGSWIV